MKKILMLATLALLAGCGGGGGSSGPPTSPGGGGGPIATASPAPTPTATPVPVFAGSVRDYDSGAGIAGATISVGSVYTAGNLTTVAATTTTAADGSYSIALPNAAPYLQITTPGDVYARMHVSTPASTNAAALNYKLIKISATDAAIRDQVIADRAANGATRVVSIDEFATEAARYWANREATEGFFNHIPPGCVAGQVCDGVSPQYGRLVGSAMYGVQFQVIDNLARGFASWSLSQQTFMLEKTNGLIPPPNHYTAIIQPTVSWVGFAVQSGTAEFPTAAPQPYYVQALVSTP